MVSSSRRVVLGISFAVCAIVVAAVVFGANWYYHPKQIKKTVPKTNTVLDKATMNKDLSKIGTKQDQARFKLTRAQQATTDKDYAGAEKLILEARPDLVGDDVYTSYVLEAQNYAAQNELSKVVDVANAAIKDPTISADPDNVAAWKKIRDKAGAGTNPYPKQGADNES